MQLGEQVVRATDILSSYCASCVNAISSFPTMWPETVAPSPMCSCPMAPTSIGCWVKDGWCRWYRKLRCEIWFLKGAALGEGGSKRVHEYSLVE